MVRRYSARGGGGLGLKFTEVGGPTMVGSDVNISCKRAKNLSPRLKFSKILN